MIVTGRAFRSLVFLVAATATAQQPGITIDQVLTRIRANIAEYRQSVPNFAADESVTSSIDDNGKMRSKRRLDTSFRVTRGPDQSLHEIRSNATLNGRRVTKQRVALPYSFNGGFADLPALLSNNCSQFRLAQPDATEAGEIIILISKKTVPDPVCSGQDYTEKAVIDATSFQIVRFEHRAVDVPVQKTWFTHMPFVLAVSNSNMMESAVDYAAAKLGDRTYWLPRRITSTLTDKSKPLVLHYEATYSNYKLYTSSVTIIPVGSSE
jgi:hypothetical protein